MKQLNATSTSDFSNIDTNEIFRVSFTHAAIGITVISPDGKWIKANNSFCQIIGYSETELKNLSFIELTHPDDRERNAELVQLLLKQKIPSFNMEKRYIHKNGKPIWVSLTVVAIFDENQFPKYIVSQVSDISQRKKVEAMMKNQLFELSKFKKAVDSTSDLIIITDPDGNVIYANNAICLNTGYEQNEILGTKAGSKWGKLMPKEFYDDMWHTIKVEKGIFKSKLKNKKKDGTEYYADVKISPVLDENGDILFFVGIERDITKEVEIDKMKTEFISLASHQLKTPLSAVKWSAELLLDPKIGPVNEAQKECVTNLNAANQRMIEIVSDMLNISKLENGKLSLDPIDVDIKNVIDGCFAELKHEIEKKNLNFQIELDNGVKNMKADKNTLKNVLSNLITNAIKYSSRNGSVRVQVINKSKEFLVRVIDSGIGIPDSEKPKIFSKFYRASNAINKNPEGTGLGLYTVKTLVEYWGGAIGFDSESGKGTTFWFTIPVSGMKSHKGEMVTG